MYSSSLDALLSKYSNYQLIDAGETIFSYGDKTDNIYLITKGLIVLFTQNETKQEREITQLKSGDILGELALLGVEGRSSKAVAYKDSRLLAFSPKDFKELIVKEANLGQKIIDSLCYKIQSLQEPAVKFSRRSTTIKENSTEKKAEEIMQDKEEEIEKLKERAIIDKTSDFYLDGHGDYSNNSGQDFDYYLYTKKITCPICSEEIEVKKTRNSRLRFQEIRSDLRPIYKKFKPDWYKIWICPNCFYTASKDNFFDFSTKEKKIIRADFKDRVINIFGSNYQPGYNQPRNLNEVFDAYYLAIELCNLIDTSKNKLAYLWLRLNWLYEDVDEEELSQKASIKAMEALREFYFQDNNTKLSRLQKDKITLLLSVLLEKHNLEEEALPLLDNLMRDPQTRPKHKRLARDRFIDIRARRKEKNSNK